MEENTQLYRRALIFVVKQMTEQQRDELLKRCPEYLFGCLLGAKMVANLSSKSITQKYPTNG